MTSLHRILARGLLALGLALAPSLTGMTGAAQAAPFSNIFAFGDSLSDSGNIAALTAPAFQPVPFGGLVPSLAYQSGRFSDGPVWVEQLAGDLGLSAAALLNGGTNFAFGGARTGPVNSVPPLPSLLEQAGLFANQLGGAGAPGDALYVVWGGANDARDAARLKLGGNGGGASTAVAQASDNVTTVVAGLAGLGARNIMVLNLPDLGLTPEAKRGPSGLVAASTAAAAEFNALLDAKLAALALNPLLRILEVDTFQLLRDVAADPDGFGLANVLDPCVDLAAVCGDPSAFLFYDGLHPTSATHRILADAALAAIPEPGTLLLLALGLALLAFGRWKGERGRASSR